MADKKEQSAGGSGQEPVAENQPLTDAQVRAKLDALLDGLTAQSVKDAATLEDMLGEGEEIRRRGITFVAVPPAIREISKIGKMLQLTGDAEDGGGQAVIDTEIAIAQRLFWIKQGDVLRQATADEISTAFTRGALTKITLDTLARNGLDPKNAEAADQG